MRLSQNFRTPLVCVKGKEVYICLQNFHLYKSSLDNRNRNQVTKMAEGGSDEVAERIICGLCSETYKQPKLLPCFHTFCLSCLEEYVKNNGEDSNAFDCPLCKTKIDLPECGVNDFLSNFYLPRNAASFTYENEDRHCCDLCGPDVNAVNHCPHCEENYCERCSEMHLKQRATRTHSLIQLLSSNGGPTIPLKRKEFCARHPKDELRVVCQDCNNDILCIICKLTEHEKHSSREIAEQANVIKENMKGNLQKADTNVHKLQKILRDITKLETETCEKRETEIKQLDDFERKLKEFIEKRTNDVREKLNRNFEKISQEVRRSKSETEAMIASLQNASIQVNQMMAVTDDIFVIRNSPNVHTVASKGIDEAGRFISNHHVVEADPELQFGIMTDIESTRRWTQQVGSYLASENKKSVSKVSEILCAFNKDSLGVISLSVFQNVSAITMIDWANVWSTGSIMVDFQPMCNTSYINFSVSVLPEKAFYSCIDPKQLKVWNKRNYNSTVVSKFQMYPHGIARRLYKCEYEEILVCLLEFSYWFSTNVCKGMVKVIPTTPGRDPYNFITEVTPAPTRVAVNKQNGLVCLSYPSVGKISVHFEDGTIMHSFAGSDLVLEPKFDGGKFTPFGICFDNDNCIVIADQYSGRVLRVNVFGKLLQVLLEGNTPTAVAVDVDDKLWVGYEDKNVTVYQMTDK